MRSKQKRIGFIIPSVNVIFEDDLRRYLPSGVSGHIARWRTPKDHDEAAEALSLIPGVAAELADAGVDAIAFACTAASVVGGTLVREAILSDITGTTGIPSLTTADGVYAAFEALAMRRILFLSPFDQAYNREEVEAFRCSGLDVIGSAALDLTTADECAALHPSELIDWVMASDDIAADGVFLNCANVRGMEAIEAIEAKTGRPAVSSNQAVIWCALRRFAPSFNISEAGSLFRK